MLYGLAVKSGAQIVNNVTLLNRVNSGRGDRILCEGTRSVEFPVLEDDFLRRAARDDCRRRFGARERSSVFIVMGKAATVVKSNCVPEIANRAPAS